jgi:hypothetical protein
MKRILGVAAVLGTLVTAAVQPAAAAIPCSPPDTCIGSPCPIQIQFDANCYAYETAYNPATYISTPGSQMTIVGLITQFGVPLNILNPNDPNKEYTFVMTGLLSKGTLVSVNGPTTLYDCDYDSLKGASFAIYEGTPRNSPATPAAWAANPFGGAVVPANHQDGTLILSGDLCGFHTNIAKTGVVQSGSFRAGYNFTGGTLYNLVSGTESLVGGLWCPGPATIGGCTRPANYTAHPNGKFDASRTTAVTRSTWGKLKQIYR